MVSKRKRGRSSAASVAEKNLGGRPPLAEEDRHAKRVYVLTTATEHEELQEAAAYVGMPMSTWIRGVVLERARALVAEKEAARKRDKQ